MKGKRILIEVGHPSDVHFFSNYVNLCEKEGAKVMFSAREKEVSIKLLKHYGFDYRKLGKNRNKLLGKLIEFVLYEIRLLALSFKFRPDIFISHGSVYAAVASFLFMKKHITYEDTGNKEQIRLYAPFSDVIITPKDMDYLGLKKQVMLDTTKEIGYLHSRYFRPDISVIEKYGFKPDNKIVFIRFVSWKATHDKYHKGLTFENKIDIINYFKNGNKILISSESGLPEELKKYQFNVEPQHIHHFLYYSSLYIGEGATMAAESVLLGTPSVYTNTSKVPYLVDMEKKTGLVKIALDRDKILAGGTELLSRFNDKKITTNIINEYLEEKIDITQFFMEETSRQLA